MSWAEQIFRSPLVVRVIHLDFVLELLSNYIVPVVLIHNPLSPLELILSLDNISPVLLQLLCISLLLQLLQLPLHLLLLSLASLLGSDFFQLVFVHSFPVIGNHAPFAQSRLASRRVFSHEVVGVLEEELSRAHFLFQILVFLLFGPLF